MCIRASGADVLVEHNVFDELYDSDAVHGFGSGTIRGNHMDHALPHGEGNHNDFIQIGEGGPWTIEQNWFGERTGGAASVWIDSIRNGVIHDVVVQNNVLTGHFAGQDVGIFIAGDDRSVALLPTNVRVINNTVVLRTAELAALRSGLFDASPGAATPRGQQRRRSAGRDVRPHPQRGQRVRRR